MADTAAAADSMTGFLSNLFTGVTEGDLLSIAIVGFVAVILARFLFARWLYRVLGQIFIFGMLGIAVYRIAEWASGEWGDGVGRVVLYAGEAVVAVLFIAMLFVVSKNRKEEKRKTGHVAVLKRAEVTSRRAPARMVAQPGQQTAMGTPRPDTRQHESGSATADVHEGTRLEEMLKKMNLLGTSKDQNLLTVFVLIVIAEFGVFTSRTVAPPSWQVGAVLFAVFFGAAVIFIRTSYKNYAKGLTHLLIAGIIAVALSLGLLIFYSSATVCHDPQDGVNATAADGSTIPNCAEAGPITAAWAFNPFNYLASDAVVAAITGVAFSILLSKGGG